MHGTYSLKEQINLDRLPQHIAIIMDGNGRWAKKHGLNRTMGHKKGAEAVRNAIEASAELGIPFLTLYAFSTENWKRPQDEIDSLMKLLVDSLNKEQTTLLKNNIRLNAIGDLKKLPEKVYSKLQNTVQLTSQNNRLTLTVALSYSARWEILNMVQNISRKIKNNELSVENINENTIQQHLSTYPIPDPDLLIRTSGEYRVSNFLLYQIAYTELYFTDVLWPDFSKEEFYKAIIDYQRRERRYGLTSEQLKK